MSKKTLVLVNATGRQSASVARVAAAVGYNVRAHVVDKDSTVARELQELENVNLVQGSLEDKRFVSKLFTGAQRAFLNTLSWGDEVAIGKGLADASKKAGVQHVVYSSMPDHSIYGNGWPALPHWSVKFTVENYIRQVGRELMAYSHIMLMSHVRLNSQQRSSMPASTTTTSPANRYPCFA